MLNTSGWNHEWTVDEPQARSPWDIMGGSQGEGKVWALELLDLDENLSLTTDDWLCDLDKVT